MDEQISILEWLKFDLANYMLHEFNEVNSEEIEGLYCIDYEKELEDVEFDMFDTIRLRIFTKIKSIQDSDHINVTFFSNYNTWSDSKLEYLLSILNQLYGPDDNGKGLLDKEDLSDLKFNIFNRSWTLGTDQNVHSLQLTKKKRKGSSFILFFSRTSLDVSVSFNYSNRTFVFSLIQHPIS